MGAMRRKWITLLGIWGVTLAATVFAQPAPDDPAQPAGAAATADGAAGPAGTAPADAEVKFQKKAKLSAKEQLRQMDDYISRMQKAKANISKLMQRALEDKDFIKANCIKDKRDKVDNRITLAKQYRGNVVKAAEQYRDDGTRDHEFNKLTLSYPKVVALEQDAEACLGEDLSFVGKLDVKMEVDPDIAKGDPTEEKKRSIEPDDIPPLASEYR